VTDIGDVQGRGLRILHLSDTHLYGDGSLHYGVVGTTAALERVLARASDLQDVDVVVLSGDLSDDGSEESYRRLRDRIEPWAAERGAEVAYAMGNHDHPDAFATVLGSRTRVCEVAGFRIVTLDSSVAGHAHGSLGTAQLDGLAGVLAEPAAHGTVVVVHHAPTSAMTPLLRLLELDDPHALLNVLDGSDVRLVLGGHYHHALSTVERGIPVVVAPGVANTADVAAPAGVERARAGSGFALIDLPLSGAPRTAFVAVPGPQDGEIVLDLDAVGIRALAAEFGAASA
jgi:Icc protein